MISNDAALSFVSRRLVDPPPVDRLINQSINSISPPYTRVHAPHPPAAHPPAQLLPPLRDSRHCVLVLLEPHPLVLFRLGLIRLVLMNESMVSRSVDRPASRTKRLSWFADDDDCRCCWLSATRIHNNAYLATIKVRHAPSSAIVRLVLRRKAAEQPVGLDQSIDRSMM